jgi:hypothetical protein
VYGKERISETSKIIKNIFFLERGTFKSLKSSEINYNIIHSKMKHILLDEFKALLDLITLVNSVNSSILPDLEEFIKKTGNSLEYNLGKTNSSIIQIPLNQKNIKDYLYNLYIKKSK